MTATNEQVDQHFWVVSRAAGNAYSEIKAHLNMLLSLPDAKSDRVKKVQNALKIAEQLKRAAADIR